MADEPEVQASGETTQTEVTTETTNQTTEQTPTTETTTQPEPKAEEPQEDWRDKEIRRKHAKLKDAEREMERLKRERDDALALAQAKADGEATEAQPERKPEPRQNISQEEIQRQARALRDQERYQEQLQSTNSAGETTYGEKWSKALDKLATFGTMDPADMTAILNTDAPAKVLFELGSNPAEYQRLMDLPPARRLTEFVKLSMKETPKPAPNISKAPPPTESVGNRVAADTDLRSEKVSDEAWYAKRQAEKAKRFEEQRALGRR